MGFLARITAALGDWKKGGYELKFITGWRKVYDYGRSHKVNNLRSSYGVFALKQGKLVGWLLAQKDGAGSLSPLDVKINSEHRRKGLATSMYQLAEKETNRKFRRSVQTTDAKKLWGQKNRPFGTDD